MSDARQRKLNALAFWQSLESGQSNASPKGPPPPPIRLPTSEEDANKLARIESASPAPDTSAKPLPASSTGGAQRTAANQSTNKPTNTTSTTTSKNPATNNTVTSKPTASKPTEQPASESAGKPNPPPTQPKPYPPQSSQPQRPSAAQPSQSQQPSTAPTPASHSSAANQSKLTETTSSSTQQTQAQEEVQPVQTAGLASDGPPALPPKPKVPPKPKLGKPAPSKSMSAGPKQGPLKQPMTRPRSMTSVNDSPENESTHDMQRPSAHKLAVPQMDRPKSLPPNNLSPENKSNELGETPVPVSGVRKWKHTSLIRYDRKSLASHDIHALEEQLESSNLSKRQSVLGGQSFHTRRTSMTAPLKQEITVNTENKVIEEIILTERDYIDDLKVLINLFLQPLREEKSLSAEDVDALFLNIEEILPVNQKLLHEFLALKQLTPEAVASVFLRMADAFKVYTLYCAKHDWMLNHYIHLKETVQRFDTFLEYTKLRPESRGLTFDGFMIKPVQRLCKYPLLLRELEKHTTPGSKENDIVIQARERIEKLLTEINNEKAKHDRLIALDNKLSPLSKEIRGLHLSASRTYREVLLEGEIEEILPKKDNIRKTGYYYLLTDLFVYCPKQTKVKYVIYLKDALLQTGSAAHNEHGVFEITYGEERDKKAIFCIEDDAKRTELFTVMSQRLEVYQAMYDMLS